MNTNDMASAEAGGGAPSGEERLAALFAQLVLQQTNLALMLLGQTPNPQTGETTRDLEAAQLFVDQLEMLEAKTKGNLSPPEARLLQQSLMTVRLAFVEAVEQPAAEKSPESQPATAASTPPPETGEDDESRQRFSKKY